MLPQNNTSRTIYINPNFKGQDQRTGDVLGLISANRHRTIYINPNFKGQQEQRTEDVIVHHNISADAHSLAKQNKTIIHMNPRFLLKLQEQEASNVIVPSVTTNLPVIAQPSSAVPSEERKIICKSKNLLIREPVVKQPQRPSIPKVSSAIQTQPLILVTKRKLIRKTVIPMPSKTEQILQASTAAAGTKSIRTKYKLDNRVIKKKAIIPPYIIKIKRKSSFVGRYALRRTSTSLTHQSSLKNFSAKKSTNTHSMNKKLQLLNINGLLYKSTRNSLQLRDMSNKTTKVLSKTSKSASSQANKPLQGGLTIFVRGTKYIMDPQKFKLTRVTNCEREKASFKTTPNKSPICRRIDIGGFTYISAPSTKNVLIRTSNHLARAYVHNAKQKSLHVLSKHLVKSNIPCPIYQRVGKCAAFERGKCSKVHNKQQVAICSKFLRGECVNSKCLLSHDVSLSKMPVCKFFLQGVCVRNDCPYLHKKLSNNAEVCIDFLRGFCQLADKCNKRHEFVCPELERTGSCANKICLYCKSKLKRQLHLEKQAETLNKKDQRMETNDPPQSGAAPLQIAAKESHDKSIGMRYFIGAPVESKLDCCNEDATEMEDAKGDESKDYVAVQKDSVRKRPKLGNLPAFIPL